MRDVLWAVGEHPYYGREEAEELLTDYREEMEEAALDSFAQRPKDFVCAYPDCDCKHICRVTGREVGPRGGGER